MKFLLFVVSLLLAGCAVNENRAVNVTLYNLSCEAVANNTDAIENVSFVIQNNERFPVECNSNIDINNETNKTAMTGMVGLLQAGEKKRVSMKLKMFLGNSAFSVSANCKKSG